MAPGTIVVVHGSKARVRDYFPKGSTSYLFPHVKVDFVGGDKNVAVALEYVHVYGGKS